MLLSLSAESDIFSAILSAIPIRGYACVVMSFSQHLFRSLLPGFLIVLLASGLMIKVLIGRSLTSEFDRGLVSRAESLMAITEQDEDGIEFEIYPFALSSYFRQQNPDYFQIRSGTGSPLFKSASLKLGQGLSYYTHPTEGGGENNITDVILPDGRRGRQIQRVYYPKLDIDDDDEIVAPDNTPYDDLTQFDTFALSKTPVIIDGVLVIPERVQLTIATSRSALDAHLAQLNFILLLTGILTTSALVFLQRRAISSAVRPIENISEQISSLGISQIDRSLAIDHPIKEIDVLATRFNRLMQDLHRGFQRERRFSADLAHEMRTPLSELKSLIEVSQRWPADQALKDSFNDDLIVSVSRMERLIQNLLALSRGDLGLMHATGTTDLRQLIPKLLNAHSATIEARKIRVSLTLTEQATVVEGHDHWSNMLENLIDNATEYSPAGSHITLSLSINQNAERVTFSIENSAPELTTGDLPHMFDRLWRKDQARSAGRHSGLGLSLVSMYATAVGAEVHAEMLDSDRLRIKITGRLEQLA